MGGSANVALVIIFALIIGCVAFFGGFVHLPSDEHKDVTTSAGQTGGTVVNNNISVDTENNNENTVVAENTDVKKETKKTEVRKTTAPSNNNKKEVRGTDAAQPGNMTIVIVNNNENQVKVEETNIEKESPLDKIAEDAKGTNSNSTPLNEDLENRS